MISADRGPLALRGWVSELVAKVVETVALPKTGSSAKRLAGEIRDILDPNVHPVVFWREVLVGKEERLVVWVMVVASRVTPAASTSMVVEVLETRSLTGRV